MSRSMFKSGVQSLCSHSLMIKPFLKRKSLSPFSITKVKNNEDKSNFTHLNPPLRIFKSNYASQSRMNTKKRRLSLTNTCKKNLFISDPKILNDKYDKVKHMLGQQKYQEVIPHLRQLIYTIGMNNKQKQLYFWLSISLGKLNRSLEAEQVLRECLQVYPNYYDGYLYLGKICTRLKKYSSAIFALQKAIQLDNTNSSAYIEMGDCYLLWKNIQQAHAIWNQGYNHAPKSITLPTRIIQSLIEIKHIEECSKYIEKLSAFCSQQSSDLLYLKGLIKRAQGKNGEACIYFEECLKYNNRKNSVTKSVCQLIETHIEERDCYAAYHVVSRAKFLGIQKDKIEEYVIFLEGVILLIKKKFEDGLDILVNDFSQKRYNKPCLRNLIHKYMAYGYFKLGKYHEAMKEYRKLPCDEMDRVSDYNLLLIQGIICVDYNFDLEEGISKFEKAKLIYPQKVQPYIYIAMAIIYTTFHSPIQDKSKAVLKALTEIKLGCKINPNSSNLLYHRTIIHFYLKNWEQAHQDINKCIQKAQENLPKYFYLRGLCYACLKNIKKAINEYSISLSLCSQYRLAYLERSKCYFLSGQSESGYKDLRRYMQMNPQDYSIHKWIGDLLYEGGSDYDAIKSYDEMKHKISFQALRMKSKSYLRMNSFNAFKNSLIMIEKHQESHHQKIGVDLTCMNLLQNLNKYGENKKQISKGKEENLKQMSYYLKQLNANLQKNFIGYVFQLIDCMNLLGVISFHLQNYQQAYQSFLLVQDLFSSMNKDQQLQKPVNNKDLNRRNIYINIFLCQIAKNKYQFTRQIKSDELSDQYNYECLKYVKQILKSLQRNQSKIVIIDNGQNLFGRKMKKIQLSLQTIIIKSSMNFYPYRENVPNLYSISVARRMIEDLHTGYIDNMPEGPWIKRNEYGVVFTDQILNNDSFTIQSTMRASKNESIEEDESTKKEDFLKKIKIDETVERKINNLILKKKVTNQTN